MSKKNKKLEEATENPVEITEETMEQDIPRLSEDDVEIVKTKEYVVNCPMLNVRKEPKVADNIASILRQGTPVIVDESYEHEDWAKIVEVPTKVVGKVAWYCMKKFLR
jgi:hypothetical protein